jgi:hypothetical protein
MAREGRENQTTRAGGRLLSSFLAVNARTSVRQEILEVAGPIRQDANFPVLRLRAGGYVFLD